METSIELGEMVDSEKTQNLPFTWDFGRIPGWKKRRWAAKWKSNYSAGLFVHHSRVDWTWQTMRWIWWWWFSWMDVLFEMARATGISSPLIKLHRPQYWESFSSLPINRPSLQTCPQPPSCPGVSTSVGLMGQKSPTGVTIHRWNWDVIRVQISLRRIGNWSQGNLWKNVIVNWQLSVLETWSRRRDHWPMYISGTKIFYPELGSQIIGGSKAMNLPSLFSQLEYNPCSNYARHRVHPSWNCDSSSALAPRSYPMCRWNIIGQIQIVS